MNMGDIILLLLKTIINVWFINELLKKALPKGSWAYRFSFLLVICINWGIELVLYEEPFGSFILRTIMLLLYAKHIFKKELLTLFCTILMAYVSTDVIQMLAAAVPFVALGGKQVAYGIILTMSMAVEVLLAVIAGKFVLKNLEGVLDSNSRRAKAGICLIAGFLEGVFVAMRVQEYTKEHTMLYQIMSLVIVFCSAILCFWIWDKKEEQKKIRELTSYAHKTREVFPTIEKAIKSVESLGNADEIASLIQEIQAVCESDKQEELQEVKNLKTFAPTGSVLLDKQLERYMEEAKKEEFNLDVIIRTPVTCVLKDKMIDVKGLLQVTGDLYVNAKRAIQRSKKVESGRKPHIFMCFGYSRAGIYEIAVFDTGEPFPEYVLKNFGKRGITTSEKGTGNGLADTLKALETGKVSLVVQNSLSEGNIFTKGVLLVFDGKGQVELEG